MNSRKEIPTSENESGSVASHTNKLRRAKKNKRYISVEKLVVKTSFKNPDQKLESCGHTFM